MNQSYPDFGQADAGFALLCEPGGAIADVLHDDFGLSETISLGQPFSVLVDRGSFSKAQDFLVTLAQKGVAFNWELNLTLAGQVKTLFFAGGRVEDKLLVVGATTNNNLLEMYESLIKIHNEQVNQWRALLKECVSPVGQKSSQDTELYDEISRLNNELVATQRELAKKNAELERLNALKNRFLGMAAHDLRNPLQAIVMYSDFLKLEAAEVLQEEQMEFLSAIRASSYFMLGLVNDLLDVSVIESGKLQLNLEPVELATLIQQNITLNQFLAAQKRLSLTFECPSAPPMMLLDKVKIGQVLDNLISNAIKYSYSDTAIVVRLAYRPPDVILSVQDGGQGIPADEQDKLFHFYERTSVKSTDGEKSTGLGLAITRNIVQKHAGEIWIESEPGQGTTFFVRLPTTLDYDDL